MELAKKIGIEKNLQLGFYNPQLRKDDRTAEGGKGKKASK